MSRRGNWPDAEQVAVYGTAPNALLGTAHVRAGELIPGRLLSPLEIAQSQIQQAGNQEAA
jgi:tRNA pseudouridine55 synthase